jgi:hypothetical protein
MMSRLLLVCLSVGILGLGFQDESSESDPATKVKSQEARKAILAYDKAEKDAKLEHDKKLQELRKQLQKELEEAQGKAIQNNQVEEAQRIAEVRKFYAELEMPATGLQIYSASYGANVSWRDVTANVRQLSRNKRKVTFAANDQTLGGDPVPGYQGPVALVVRYGFDGRVGHKAVYRGHSITLP